jgi:hypothetical protein
VVERQVTLSDRFKQIALELDDKTQQQPEDEPCYCEKAEKMERIIPYGTMYYYYCPKHGKHWQKIKGERY